MRWTASPHTLDTSKATAATATVIGGGHVAVGGEGPPEVSGCDLNPIGVWCQAVHPSFDSRWQTALLAHLS